MPKRSIARITALGTYLPEKVLTNQDFEKLVDTSDEWISSRTGIKERRVAAQNEACSDMGVKAAQNALIKAGLTPQDIELILVATLSPDYTSSSAAAIIQDKLGAGCVPAFDIQAACSGFIYALSIAKAYIESGMHHRILVIASEKMTAYVDYCDRSTSVLFGDGAAAVIVTDKGEGLTIDALDLGADGSLVELLYIPAGGSKNPATEQTFCQGNHYFKMAGKEVFKHAVKRMSAAIKQCLIKMDLHDDHLSWLVPHQANLRIMEAVAKGLKIPADRMYKTVHKYGNTSASSVAIALQELMEEHELEAGEHILLVAFGAGLTWGAAILTKIKH